MADEQMTAGLQYFHHPLENFAFGLRIKVDHDVAQENQVDLFNWRQGNVQVDLRKFDAVA